MLPQLGGGLDSPATMWARAEGVARWVGAAIFTAAIVGGVLI
ncbi:MAG TPA: hypothetical protein VGI23_16500 [Steroidobacteraceae bacterium]